MALLPNILDSDNYSDYFKGQFYLDITGSQEAQLARQTGLDNFVEQVQKDVFKELFGEALYNYLYDNVDESVYTDLRDGETITYDGKKYVWEGLRPMVAYFVYFKYVQSLEGRATPVGFQQTDLEDSKKNRALMAHNAKSAWNNGAGLYRDAISYIDYKNNETEDYYPDFDPCYGNYYKYLT